MIFFGLLAFHLVPVVLSLLLATAQFELSAVAFHCQPKRVAWCASRPRPLGIAWILQAKVDDFAEGDDNEVNMEFLKAELLAYLEKRRQIGGDELAKAYVCLFFLLLIFRSQVKGSLTLIFLTFLQRNRENCWRNQRKCCIGIHQWSPEQSEQNFDGTERPRLRRTRKVRI